MRAATAAPPLSPPLLTRPRPPAPRVPRRAGSEEGAPPAHASDEEGSPRDEEDRQAGSRLPDVLWINLREEPIVYVNGRPFVLRQLHAPTYNVAHSGIATEHVEGMEVGLKEDLEREAEEAGAWRRGPALRG